MVVVDMYRGTSQIQVLYDAHVRGWIEFRDAPGNRLGAWRTGSRHGILWDLLPYGSYLFVPEAEEDE